MSGSAESTRGIRTLPTEGSQLTSAEQTWVIAEAAAGNWVHNETPSGTPTGTDGTDGLAIYSLANTPKSTAVIWLYKNGTLMNYGSNNDYTVSGTTITFNSGAIPVAGDKLLCTYRK